MSAAAPPLLIDTHAHLQDPVFDPDREAMLARAWSAGVRVIVCVGYDLESSRRAVELAGQHAGIYAAVGIHPNYAGRADESAWKELAALARAPRVVGIGETGLDNYRNYTPAAVQELWFRRHVRLAREVGLPVIVHNRQADEQVLALLAAELGPAAAEGRPPAVMHCFSSSAETLRRCLDLGLIVSFAGNVTFKNAGELREVARSAPAGRFVVETDCPYLTPHPYRGTRNEPARVQLTVRYLAELRGERFESVARVASQTAQTLFSLDSMAEPGAVLH